MSPVRRNDGELAKDAPRRQVVAEMHEATRAAPAGHHHGRPGRRRPGGPRAPRATSNFLGYHGFPAVICTSPNSMIVHGIPGGYVLEEGDILSIDLRRHH